VFCVIPEAFRDPAVKLFVGGVHVFEVFGCVGRGQDSLGDHVLLSTVGEVVLLGLQR